ncbi:LOW QUALITY PROTEIN: hypothetical protein KUTeg_021131 [Tegillarca granosa]|uniref:Protein amnionless n=1 Tax=Tegillarca granosa TaxID=220873 RepID=A0ABQ9ECB6_TEGGR|nr:LOW QUALITY PROTEIN: hypothetical protein KUTeg_021131 [Tegillarca granosa]
MSKIYQFYTLKIYFCNHVHRLCKLEIHDISYVKSEAVFKRWLPNTDFGNPKNWKSGRPPCGNDIVVIQEESPSVFLQINTTISELRLPKNGEIVLGPDSTLAFTNNADHSAGCLSSASEKEFNATYPSDWLDPKNWCSSDTETGGCINSPRLDSEMVPCRYDDVVFPKGHSYFVNLDIGFDLTVNTLKIAGKSFTSGTFSDFLGSREGRLMFPVPRTGSRSTMTIQRRSCNDPTGCACGNDDDKNIKSTYTGLVNALRLLKHICSIQSPHCRLAQCKSSLQPTGSCCRICVTKPNESHKNEQNKRSIFISTKLLNNSLDTYLKKRKQVTTRLQHQSGGILTLTFASGFRLDRLRDGLKRNVLDGKDEYKNVVFMVSKTTTNKIQIVLSDENGLKSSDAAKQMEETLDNDIATGGFRYGVREVILETSQDSSKPVTPGAQKGSQESMPGGEIAGIVVGLFVVLLIGLLLAFFVYRRKTRGPDDLGFKVFDKMSFRNKFKKPQVEVPPSFGFRFGGPSTETIGTQGFDNPMYGSNPLENEKPLDLELMPTPPIDSEEQPTFDTERGFDNPLYDTAVQESFFSDPTSINSDALDLKQQATDNINDTNA